MEQKILTGYPSIDKPWMKYYNNDLLKRPVPKMNIYSYLREMTKEHLNLTAMSYYGKSISYKKLFNHIDEAARVLLSLGVKPGERIMYLMPNIPETAYFLYGGARIGAVADYVDPRPDSIDLRISATKILDMIRDEKCKYIVALDQCYLAMLKSIEPRLIELGLEQIILVDASYSMDWHAKAVYFEESLVFNGFGSVLSRLSNARHINKQIEIAKKESKIKLLDLKTRIKESRSVALPAIPYYPNQMAVIVHTSGTSSAKPKAIPLTHDNMNFYVQQTFAANMPMNIGDKALHILPYFAAFGVVDVAHAGFCHANNLIQIPEFSPINLGKLIKKYKPQTIIGAPSWFQSLVKDSSLRKADLSCLTMATYGGDSMDIKDEDEINYFLSSRNARCTLSKGHGMSETCGCASYAIGEYNIPASVGIPMPWTTYAIVNPETKELLKFEDNAEYLEGELIISSGAVTSGVLDEKTIVPSVEYNGERYIFTRDIARMNKNGVITFLSRSDRSITRFDGYKIKPHEVENIIKNYPGIHHCIVSPVYDKTKFGNTAIADIVLKGEIVPSRSEQVLLVRDMIEKEFIQNPSVSSRQIPVLFRFRSIMPLTVNGKIDFKALTKEKLSGDEVQVLIDETNISVNSIIVN